MDTQNWTEEDSKKAIARKKFDLKEAFASLRFHLEVNGELLTQDRNHIINLTFTELKHKLQHGELTVTKVLEAYQSKALLSTEKLCNVTEFVPQAKEWAKARDKILPENRKPLHGIPISVKDMFDIEGMDSSNGLSKNLFHPKQKTAVILEILLEQGAVPFCKTNVPVACRRNEDTRKKKATRGTEEALAQPKRVYSMLYRFVFNENIQNAIYGTTLNPHNHERTPGGSSGGESSLIADGGSILGIGTDICGSIRMPAHACGVYGMKPSTLRISQIGESTISRGLIGLTSSTGFLARDTDSIIAAMEALLTSNRMFDMDSEVIPLNWNKNLMNTERVLRIGYNFGQHKHPLTPGCLRALRIAQKGLQRMGHLLIPVDFPDTDNLKNIAYKLSRSEESLQLLPLVKGEIIHDSMVEDIVLQTEINSNEYVHAYMKTYAEKLEFKKKLTQIWEDNKLDVVLGPILQTPASKFEDVNVMLNSCDHITMMNLCNFAAALVPVTFETKEDQRNLTQYPDHTDELKCIKKMTEGCDGMPIGVQLSALPWREETLCYAMKQLQCALEQLH